MNNYEIQLLENSVIVNRTKKKKKSKNLSFTTQLTPFTSGTSGKWGNDIKIILQEPFLRIESIRRLKRKKPDHDSGALLQQTLHLALIFHYLFNKCARL